MHGFLILSQKKFEMHVFWSIAPLDARIFDFLPFPLFICTWFLKFYSLMNLIFSLFQTWILATAGRKIQFKLGKIQFIKLRPNQTEYFKLENCKNQVQIDRYLSLFLHLNNGVKVFWRSIITFIPQYFQTIFLETSA